MSRKFAIHNMFYDSLKDICKQNGIILIIDETPDYTIGNVNPITKFYMSEEDFNLLKLSTDLPLYEQTRNYRGHDKVWVGV